MMQHMKPCNILRKPAGSKNALLEDNSQPTLLTQIDIAISTVNGATNTANNMKTVNSTHIGITDFKGLIEGDTVSCAGASYTIDFVNDLARKTIIFLKEVR